MNKLAVLAATAAVVALPSISFAADTTIDIGGAISSLLTGYVVPALVALVTALLGLLAVKVKQWTGVEIDKGHRDAIAGFVALQAGAWLASIDTLKGVKIDAGNETVAALANQALDRIPDALAHFNITPETIADMIVGKIGVLTATEPDVT